MDNDLILVELVVGNAILLIFVYTIFQSRSDVSYSNNKESKFERYFILSSLLTVFILRIKNSLSYQ